MAGNLSADEKRLNDLIADVKTMGQTLTKRVQRLNEHVDEVGAAWKGEAATQYSETQRKANLYAEKLTRQLAYLEQVLEMSRDGFTGEELRQVGDYKALAAKSPISDFV